ncbi:hypothetical protein MCOR25_001598 [Pyricularia grisea]|uniref:Uncharacterized protein n=1 Tax=Pyricularia grisea TaxID=148305 RepID=A0A6P8BL34_PYRGI|nr:uncharacterized protein PgNI_00980 [Pyricularia grisea]KAI6380665.1 hypothetical protein MCOR25_001598 [Pyricularia grisea]TLD17312.1 hypothetical protein PgNI_00980 [Pyricularia grisea]
MPQETTENDCPQARGNDKTTNAAKSSANTSRRYHHAPLIESSYGEIRALQDPDAYIRHLCTKMVSERPWIKFEEIYHHLRCKPSHQIIADFPMSHRCFLSFNRLLEYLKGCFTTHSDWREAVNKHGELPFDPELFTRGFFAARTALGYGTTRFTLLGGPKERGWADGIAKSKLDYLNHDPNTPRGQVHPFWAGFYEHQVANWDHRIEPAVKEAMRTFGKDRRELKRKRDYPNDENSSKRPNKRDTAKAQNDFVAAAMKRLVVSDQPRVNPPAEQTEPATRDQEPFDQASPAPIIPQSVPAANSESVLATSDDTLGKSVFDPLSFMYTPEEDSKHHVRPSKIDLQAAKAAREATKAKSSTLDEKDVSETVGVYDNVSSDGNVFETSDDDDIEAGQRKTPSKIKGGFAVPQAARNTDIPPPRKTDTSKLPADTGSAATEPPKPTIKSVADLPTETLTKSSAKPTKPMSKTPGKHVAVSPTTPRPSTRLVKNPRGQTFQRFPAGMDAQDGEDSDSSVTVGFPTPRRKRM